MNNLLIKKPEYLHPGQLVNITEEETSKIFFEGYEFNQIRERKTSLNELGA
jgi:hypothetical protein